MSASSTGSDKQEMGGAIDDPDPISTSSTQPEGGGGQWIYHPVIRPMTMEQCENVPVIPLQPPGKDYVIIIA